MGTIYLAVDLAVAGTTGVSWSGRDTPYCLHVFDALRFITGEEIVRVRATTRKLFNSCLEDVVVAEVILSNGCLGIVEASKVSPGHALGDMNLSVKWPTAR